MKRFKIIFYPICFITGLYSYIKYGKILPGFEHHYKEQNDRSLECKVCGCVR